MAKSISECPKCAGTMEAGYLPDAAYAGQQIGRWAPGPATKSRWTVTKVAKETIPMCAFRCSECGYVELYARDEFVPQ